MREQQEEPNWLEKIAYCAIGISIPGAIVCGILECFSVDTGFVGLCFGIIAGLALPAFIVAVILNWVLAHVFPDWEKETIENVSLGIVIFAVIGLLCYIFYMSLL